MQRLCGLPPERPAAKVRADERETRKVLQYAPDADRIGVVVARVSKMAEHGQPPLAEREQGKHARVVDGNLLHVRMELYPPQAQIEDLLHIGLPVLAVRVQRAQRREPLRVRGRSPVQEAVDGGYLMRRRGHAAHDMPPDPRLPAQREQRIHPAVPGNGVVVKAADAL